MRATPSIDAVLRFLFLVMRLPLFLVVLLLWLSLILLHMFWVLCVLIGLPVIWLLLWLPFLLLTSALLHGDPEQLRHEIESDARSYVHVAPTALAAIIQRHRHRLSLLWMWFIGIHDNTGAPCAHSRIAQQK